MSEPIPEITMDREGLYREEVFTDRKAGTIRRLSPVNAMGHDDPTRAVQFIGSAQVLTPAGALPIAFELDANSLEAAVDAFAEGARKALESTMEELREMQRQAASSIVVPQSGSGGAPGGGIQMP